MNALTDYTGTNPLLLKYSLLIFSNTKYLVNKRQIVETLPEGVAPAEISEDVPTVGVSPEVPSEGFSLQDFKDAILEISGTIFADYDPDTNDMSQPFRSFWNVCRVGLPQDATLKGFGRLMNGCFVTPINKLLLPTIGEDTYPSNLYESWTDNNSDTSHYYVTGLGVLNSERKMRYYLYMLARRIRPDMGRGYWVGIMNSFLAKLQKAFDGTGETSVSNQLANQLGRSSSAVANRYAMVVETVLLHEAQRLLGLAYNGIDDVTAESQNMARVDYMNTGMPYTYIFVHTTLKHLYNTSITLL